MSNQPPNGKDSMCCEFSFLSWPRGGGCDFCPKWSTDFFFYIPHDWSKPLICCFFRLWKHSRCSVHSPIANSTTLGRICIKLVIVMGITWIADIISWAHSIWFGSQHFIWIITDLINALQGVFIFIVIGCQPQVNIHHLIWFCSWALKHYDY